MGAVIAIVVILLLVAVAIWAGRGKPNDSKSSRWNGGWFG